MYEANIAVLREAVRNRTFITNISHHHLPDGTLDYARNRRVWENAVKPFEKIDLWGDGSAWAAFIPTEEHSAQRPTIIIAHGGGFNWRTGCEAGNTAWYFH